MEFKLQSYSLETDKHPDEVSYKIIKSILSNNSPADNTYKKKLAISDFIRKFSTEKYLNIVIRFLRINRILKNENQIFKQLESLNYNTTDCIKQKAQLYGVLLEYETQITYYLVFIKNNIPTLKFKFAENYFFHNMESIASELIRLHNIGLTKYLEKLPPKIQKETYSQLVNFYSDFDYRKEKKYFEEDAEYFKRKKDNVDITVTSKKVTNPYTHIFVSDSAYLLFKSFADQIKKETELADYSFLYRKMIEDNLMFDFVKNTVFINWLEESEFNTFIDRVKTVSNLKTSTKARLYQALKDLYKP